MECEEGMVKRDRLRHDCCEELKELEPRHDRLRDMLNRVRGLAWQKAFQAGGEIAAEILRIIEDEKNPFENEKLKKLDEIRALLGALYKKYPGGEFVEGIYVSLDFERVSGVVCWDWKKHVHHIEHETVDKFIEYLKNEAGLRKENP